MSDIENVEKPYLYKIDDIKTDEVLIYHHLGLGDVIICNGMINFLSEKRFKKINLIIDKKFINSVLYLYSNNENINLIPVNLTSLNNADEDVNRISLDMNLKPLKIGFKYYKKVKFYKAFYKQVNIPYRYSYKYFSQPRDPQSEDKLLEHLIKFYNIKTKNYNLVHTQASDMRYEINIDNKNDNIFIERESDKYKNIFLYNKLIENAEEIHCINSSFCHYVDRVNTKSDLYYHDVRGSKLKLRKKWKLVKYGN